MKQWHETFFANFANQYDKQPFTAGTKGEVDFIESEVNHDLTARVLDVGRGTGRHSVELARRVYSVVGVGLSESMLAKARAKAQAGGVKMEFILADARSLPFHDAFDNAIMLCEGASPLMQTDGINFLILKSAAQELKPGGKFIFTTLNGLFPLFHSVMDFVNNESSDPQSSNDNLDLITFRQTSIISFDDDNGEFPNARHHSEITGRDLGDQLPDD